MHHHRLIFSCLLGLFLLCIGPVASSWALDGMPCDAPEQGIGLVDAVKNCAEHNDSSALPDFEDLPAGDPPVMRHRVSVADPRLQQALNAAAEPRPSFAPAVPPHKPPSA